MVNAMVVIVNTIVYVRVNDMTKVMINVILINL